MNIPCPCCAGTGRFDPDIEELRDECERKGITVMRGDRVSLPNAATLLGVAYGTLRNWRCSRDLPRGELINGCITYTLTEIVTLRASMTSQ